MAAALSSPFHLTIYERNALCTERCEKSTRLVYRQTIDAVWSKSKFISKMTNKKR